MCVCVCLCVCACVASLLASGAASKTALPKDFRYLRPTYLETETPQLQTCFLILDLLVLYSARLAIKKATCAARQGRDGSLSLVRGGVRVAGDNLEWQV